MVTITHFTDPGCPWAFSAEPRLRRIDWLYGEQLAWETRMLVLSESADDYEEKGFDTAKQASSYKKMADWFGMPIEWSERPAMAATIVACRPVVAARLHGPAGAADRLLRRLRVNGMGGNQFDDPATIERATREAGLDPDTLAGWQEDPAVEAALREDMAAARDPDPTALALDHKLAPAGDGRRYTCPSLELRTETMTVVTPGFQPVESYEVAISHLAPELERRDDPGSVEEVLAWAGIPLATVEVAEVRGGSVTDVRAELAASGAGFEPVAADGYWSLAAA
jgi:predicted DsbA family dithiol-disulfide isomerase